LQLGSILSSEILQCTKLFAHKAVTATSGHRHVARGAKA
jgi:hypothetical protein